MRQWSLGEAIGDSLASNGLLSYAADHLTQIDGISLAATEGHDQRFVVSVQMHGAVISYFLSNFGEGWVEQRLKGFSGWHAWFGLKLALLELAQVAAIGWVSFLNLFLVDNFKFSGGSDIWDADGHAIVAKPPCW